MSNAPAPIFAAPAVDAADAPAPAPAVAAAAELGQVEDTRVYHEDTITNTLHTPLEGGYETTQTIVCTRSYLQNDGGALSATVAIRAHY